MTQEEFAHLLGYSDKSMIAHLENGDNEMTYEKILLLTDKLHISPSELFIDETKLAKEYVQKVRRYLGNQKIILNCAGGIVLKNDKILLQRRSDNNEWGLVGGLLELDESYLDAAIREIKEETGLTVKAKSFLGIFHNYNMMWGNGDKAHTIGAYYVFEIVDGELRIDEESYELKFFSLSELPHLFAEDHRAAVKAYMEGISLPIFKEN
ncbi:MAG: NUDIX domain-containing protein [Gammaproteobacteria bacterium]|nr:NUDIX domain-containing protein [Gammaproteobacteria bacterium]